MIIPLEQLCQEEQVPYRIQGGVVTAFASGFFPARRYPIQLQQVQNGSVSLMTRFEPSVRRPVPRPEQLAEELNKRMHDGTRVAVERPGCAFLVYNVLDAPRELGACIELFAFACDAVLETRRIVERVGFWNPRLIDSILLTEPHDQCIVRELH